MASNSSPTPSRATRYFCHRCVREVDNINQDSFTCPFCNQGFLEELRDNENIHHESEDEEVYGDPANAAAVDFNQFFRNVALPMIFGGGMQGMQGNVDGQPPSSSAGGQQAAGQAQQGQGAQGQTTQGQQPPGNMGGPFQGFLQNLLEGLAGGGGAVQFRVQFGDDDGQARVFGYPFPLHGNPGDYAWGPGGLDAIVTQLLNQFEGGAPPLSTEQIEGLPKMQISQEHIDKRLQCTVCMDDFKLQEMVRQLPCGHSFHDACIIPWLTRHNTCPVCRKTAVEVNASNSGNTGPPGGPSNSGSRPSTTRDQSRQQQQQPWDVIEELD